MTDTRMDVGPDIAPPTPRPPRRTNSATVTAPGWKPWTGAEEKRLLAAKVRGATKEELIAEFPHRTWTAIKHKRCKIGSVGVPLTLLRRRELPTYERACLLFRMLTARRRTLKIRREWLADQLEVGLSTIQHWEYGLAEPHWQRLLKWCDLLGMEIVAREKPARPSA